MFRRTRLLSLALPLVVAMVAAACGSEPPASPSGSARGSASAGPSGSGVPPSGSATPSAAAKPTVAGFWTSAARALSKSGRLRLVMTGSGKRELRYQPKASGVIADGALTSACVSGGAWTIDGFRSAKVPGKWACGGSALVSSFRKSGQPVYAWNTRLPVDSKIKERVSVAKGRWQWDYTATSKILGGTVKTTLVLDPTTGRLVSGSRTDPTGTTRYTFSYTTIFAPIAVP